MDHQNQARLASFTRRNRHRLAGSAAVGVLLFAAGGALAQTQPAGAAQEPDVSVIDEIVVTAQRRAQNLQDVPITVAAFNQESLENLGIGSTDDLQFAVPGIVNTQTGGDGISAVYIRGVGTGYSGPGLEGSVAFYLDDVFLQTQTSSAQASVDLAQVQVLKGPQGTLYGRNATGGAILVTTKDPRLDTVEGSLKVGLGNLDWRRTEGVLNLPVGSTVAIRGAGYYEERDGFVRNIAFPDEPRYGVGSGESYGGRVKLLWEPSDNFSTIGTVSYDRRDGNGAIHVLQRTGAGVPTGLGFHETTQSPNREGGGGEDFDSLLTSIRAEWTTGVWTISDTLAYRRVRGYGCTDNDAVPAELLYFCLVSDRSPNPNGADGKRDDTLTNELRIVSDTGGPFDVTAGFFYEKNRSRFAGRIGGGFFGALLPTFDNRDTLEAYSIYVEGYYSFTERLKLTGGLRYTTEEKYHSSLQDADSLALTGGTIAFADQEADWSNVSPRLVLSYDADTINYYASYNQGFKSGGFTSPVMALSPALDPETIDAFEVGAKYRSHDGRVRISTAAFYYDWQDVQVSFVTGGGSGILQQNAASAEVYGFELSGEFSPAPAWDVVLGTTYTHGRYVDFPGAAVYNLVGGNLTASAEDLSGKPLPQSPDWTANASVTYSFGAPAGWDGSVTAAARYSSEYDFAAGAGGQLRASRQDAMTLVNLNARFTPPVGDWEVGVFVSNVLDEEYKTLISTGDTGVYFSPAEPRLYGVTLTYSF